MVFSHLFADFSLALLLQALSFTSFILSVLSVLFIQRPCNQKHLPLTFSIRNLYGLSSKIFYYLLTYFFTYFINLFLFGID